MRDDVLFFCTKVYLAGRISLDELEWKICLPIKGLREDTYYTACKNLLLCVHSGLFTLLLHYITLLLLYKQLNNTF